MIMFARFVTVNENIYLSAALHAVHMLVFLVAQGTIAVLPDRGNLI